jgi:hypothetical protein
MPEKSHGEVPMIAYEVKVNGKKVATVGLREGGVISLIANWVSLPKTKKWKAAFAAGGMRDGWRNKGEFLQWFEKGLRLGDEISYRLIETNRVDKPHKIKRQVEAKQRGKIKVGDKVRVLRVPPAVNKEVPAETRKLFRRCVGKVRRVDGFGKYGHLELNVHDDGTQATCCANTIWIEPECVEVVKGACECRKRRG